MLLDRRSLLASLCWMAASPALAVDAPPELESYERESGGRIGVYAESLATGAKLTWRADERFVMCSTFKASLAACVLARVDRGEEQLAAMIPYGNADLLEYAPAAKQNLPAGAMSVTEMCKAIVELSRRIRGQRRRSGHPAQRGEQGTAIEQHGNLWAGRKVGKDATYARSAPSLRA